VDVQDVRTQFEYVFWAHDRMMGPVASLSPEEFTRDLRSGHGSVRDTLVHMMSSDWIWLSRWHGISPTAMIDISAFPSLETVEERWKSLHHELSRFLGQVHDEDLVAPVTYRNIRGEELTLPLVCTLQHLMNHNTYHRGQVATLLRQLGREPANTDISLFFLEDESRTARLQPRFHPTPAYRGGENDDEGEED